MFKKIALLIFVLIINSFGTTKSHGQFEIVNFSIDSAGVGESSGGNFAIIGVIGEAESGTSTGGSFSLTAGFQTDSIVVGDVNGDGLVDLLDVAPFVLAIADGIFVAEADINNDGIVNLLDVDPFVALLSGG